VKRGTGYTFILIASIGVFFCCGSLAYTVVQSANSIVIRKGTKMSKRASGTFEVKITPQAQQEKAENGSFGRMLLDKQFHGDIEAVGKGEMMVAGTEVKDSAGYVALERVAGKLNGRSGAFILQHSGIMTRGVGQLSVAVVPDSGTGQLTGIAGTMAIKIVDGKHLYDFDYTLPENP
jgi:hypothetical protein